MSTLKERMQEVMSNCDWTIHRTAEIAGVSRSAVCQWIGQGAKEVKTIARVDVAERLSSASGYSAMWIANGEGQKNRLKALEHSTAWPFEQIDEISVRGLSTQDLRSLEAAILISAGHLGLKVKRP